MQKHFAELSMAFNVILLTQSYPAAKITLFFAFCLVDGEFTKKLSRSFNAGSNIDKWNIVFVKLLTIESIINKQVEK